MPEPAAKGSADQAIASIVQMKPQKVSVSVTLPVAGRSGGAVLALEWSREDTNMPLSELLKRIETYAAQYGSA
ncbi:MAG TPA: hypothetical protein VFG07_01385 [Thermoplasmata archaeon]|nr:hypothetical protein [Thermoplasmata archaeon]